MPEFDQTLTSQQVSFLVCAGLLGGYVTLMSQTGHADWLTERACEQETTRCATHQRDSEALLSGCVH